jgi:hypothetical protein
VTGQVERKRHLGNDVVLLVFLHPAVHSFDARTLTSHFNSAFLCVRPTSNGEYELACAARAELRPVRPYLPSSARLSGTVDEVRARVCACVCVCVMLTVYDIVMCDVDADILVDEVD